MPYRRSTAVQERLDADRARLVEVATALIAEHGYPACSVAAVARAAGVATGTVYRHFPDKASLFAEVFRRAAQREVDAVRDAARARDAGEPAPERLRRAVETFVRRALRAPRLAHALTAEPVDAGVETERLRSRAAYRDVFATVVAEGVERGELPRQDPVVAAAATVGAIAEALLVPSELPPDPDHADQVVTYVLRALGAIDAHP